MPWGIRKLAGDRFERQMATTDEWLNEMWKAYKVNLGGMEAYKPQTTRERCENAHGGGWDKVVWKGNSYGSEKGYCTDCGREITMTSPWHDAAYAAYLKTRFYNQAERDGFLEKTAKSIKYGKRGRRKIVSMTDGEKHFDVMIESHGYGNDAWFRGRGF